MTYPGLTLSNAELAAEKARIAEREATAKPKAVLVSREDLRRGPDTLMERLAEAKAKSLPLEFEEPPLPPSLARAAEWANDETRPSVSGSDSRQFLANLENIASGAVRVVT